MFTKITFLSLILASSLMGRMISTLYSGDSVIENDRLTNTGEKSCPNDPRTESYNRHNFNTLQTQNGQKYIVDPNNRYTQTPRVYTETYQVEGVQDHERYGQNPYEVGYDQVQVDRMKAKRDTNQYLVPSTYQVGGTIDLRNDKDLQHIYYGRKNGTKMTDWKIEQAGSWNEPVEIAGSVVYTLINPDSDQRRRKYEKSEVYFEGSNITRTVVIQTN